MSPLSDKVQGSGELLELAELAATCARDLAGDIEIVSSMALRALALTTDSSVLTAAANDFGFEDVFARQVEAMGREGDLLLVHSTKGSR